MHEAFELVDLNSDGFIDFDDVSEFLCLIFEFLAIVIFCHLPNRGLGKRYLRSH